MTPEEMYAEGFVAGAISTGTEVFKDTVAQLKIAASGEFITSDTKAFAQSECDRLYRTIPEDLQPQDLIGPFRFTNVVDGGYQCYEVVGLRWVTLHYATVHALLGVCGVQRPSVEDAKVSLPGEEG